ncbi:MAG: hypothetical protein ACXWK3_19340 [Reyranella sp.]
MRIRVADGELARPEGSKRVAFYLIQTSPRPLAKPMRDQIIRAFKGR